MFSEQLPFMSEQILSIGNVFSFPLTDRSSTKLGSLGYVFLVVGLIFEHAARNWVLSHPDGDLGCVLRILLGVKLRL